MDADLSLPDSPGEHDYSAVARHWSLGVLDPAAAGAPQVPVVDDHVVGNQQLQHGVVDVDYPDYPERTVYEITDAGRETAREWLDEMLAVPRGEFPQFPAALSHVLMLTKPQILDALARRLDMLTDTLADLKASLKAEAKRGLPRIAMLETEYLRAVTAAEVTWLRATVDDLRSGKLSWSAKELVAFSEAGEVGG